MPWVLTNCGSFFTSFQHENFTFFFCLLLIKKHFYRWKKLQTQSWQPIHQHNANNTHIYHKQSLGTVMSAPRSRGCLAGSITSVTPKARMLQNFCGNANQVQAWKSIRLLQGFQEEITDRLSGGKPNIWLAQRSPSAEQTEPFNWGWSGRQTPASWPWARRPNRLGARSPKSAHFPRPHTAVSLLEGQVKERRQKQKAP